MFGPVFGIGFTEMILVGIVILLLFSPRELPGMMKTIAKVYGSIRRSAEDFRAQVMQADELREPIEEIRAAYHGTKQELLSAQDLARRELGRARSEAMKAQQKLAQLAREESRRDAPPALHAPATATLKGRVSTQDNLDDDPPATPSTPVTTPASGPSASTSSATAASSSSSSSSVTAPAVPVSAVSAVSAPTVSAPATSASPSPANDRSDAA